MRSISIRYKILSIHHKCLSMLLETKKFLSKYYITYRFEVVLIQLDKHGDRKGVRHLHKKLFKDPWAIDLAIILPA